MPAVDVVVLIAVHDVEVAALFGAVAVALGHTPSQRHHPLVVGGIHVARHVLLGIRVWPEDKPAGGVEAEHACQPVGAVVDEVAVCARFRREERIWPAIEVARWVAARATAAAPRVAELAIEVDPHRARARYRLAVLAPLVEAAALEVELGAVRIHHRRDVDDGRVEDRRDAPPKLRVLPVVVGQHLDQVDRQLARGPLSSVHQAVDEHLRPALIAGRRIGRQAYDFDGAALVAAADGEFSGDVGVLGDGAVDHRIRLGVRVEVPEAGRLGSRNRAGRRREGGNKTQDQPKEQATDHTADGHVTEGIARTQRVAMARSGYRTLKKVADAFRARVG